MCTDICVITLAIMRDNTYTYIAAQISLSMYISW